MHRTGDRTTQAGGSRLMAKLIPGARYIEYPGIDHLPWTQDDTDRIVDDMQEFITGSRPIEEADRVLATVMFADIVDSTQRAAKIGDRAWSGELQDFYGLARRELERFRGRAVDTAGDGSFATFDGPARA